MKKFFQRLALAAYWLMVGLFWFLFLANLVAIGLLVFQGLSR